MLYSIIDTKKGEANRLYARLHRTLANGTKMIVNENELRLVNEDIEVAASKMGGYLMPSSEVDNEIKKIDKDNE